MHFMAAKKLYFLKSPTTDFEAYPIEALNHFFDDMAVDQQESERMTNRSLGLFGQTLDEDPGRTDLADLVDRLKKLGTKLLVGWKQEWGRDQCVFMTMFPKGEISLTFSKGFPAARRKAVIKKLATATAWEMYIVDDVTDQTHRVRAARYRATACDEAGPPRLRNHCWVVEGPRKSRCGEQSRSILRRWQ